MTLTIDARFNGPPDSGNGGYVAGRLAALAAPPGSAVSVTLRRPPPLRRPLRVARDGDAVVRLLDGDVLVAEASDGPLPADPVPALALEAVHALEATYAGQRAHPFPTCFVCGIDRLPGDGLLLRPGRTSDGRTACTWVPDHSLLDASGRIGAEFVWAALDCPGGWTVDLAGRPLVLGRMTARLLSAPAEGEPCLVMGRLLGSEGRKTFTSTTGYGADGRELGRAQSTWIALPSAPP